MRQRAAHRDVCMLALRHELRRPRRVEGARCRAHSAARRSAESRDPRRTAPSRRGQPASHGSRIVLVPPALALAVAPAAALAARARRGRGVAKAATLLAAAVALSLIVAFAAECLVVRDTGGHSGPGLDGELGGSPHLQSRLLSRDPHVRFGPQPVGAIASIDSQGSLSLDFGDVRSPDSSSWNDVFRMTSSAQTSLQIAFTTSGAIAPFIQSVAFVNDATTATWSRTTPGASRCDSSCRRRSPPMRTPAR